MTQERERLHTAVLVAPSKERRKLRKQRHRAEARLHAEQRKATLAAAKANPAMVVLTFTGSATMSRRLAYPSWCGWGVRGSGPVLGWELRL